MHVYTKSIYINPSICMIIIHVHVLHIHAHAHTHTHVHSHGTPKNFFVKSAGALPNYQMDHCFWHLSHCTLPSESKFDDDSFKM